MTWTTEAPWKGVRRPLAKAEPLPQACYADPGFFELEQERVFGRSWVGVGPSGHVSRPGEMIVRSVGGQSVIITRNREGELRAFRNSCRHRGTELAAADCVVDGVIRCPYHRWGYDLDGTLVATPRFDEMEVDSFDRRHFGLHPVRVDAFAGVLFVCLDPAVAPLTEWFGDLGARLAGYGLDGWRIQDSIEIDINANWKLISENFQEYYHLPWVHPELSKVSKVADHYRFQGHGMYCGQCTTPVSGDERDDWLAMPPAAGLSDSDAASGRFVALFPNVLLSVLPNHAYVMCLEPLAPGLTRETGVWLVPPNEAPVSEARFAATKEFWIDVNNEDVEIVERGQRGISKGGYVPGRLSPRFEEPLHRFYNLLADRFVGVDRIPDGDPADDLDLLGSGVNPLPWRAGQ